MSRFISLFLFVLFSGCGLGAIFVSVTAGELKIYYHNRIAVNQAKENLENLKKINSDYNILLERLKTEPNFAKRAIPPVLATQPNEPNTAYPKAKSEQLKAAAKALTKDKQADKKTEIPDWLKRCNNPKIRWLLFFCGAGLIIISLVFFLGNNSGKQVSQNEGV